MGLFKSKEERRIEREMKIRQGVRSIEKSIRQQEKFSEDFIKNARHAQQIGDQGQYQFIRSALKKTAAVKKPKRWRLVTRGRSRIGFGLLTRDASALRVHNLFSWL